MSDDRLRQVGGTYITIDTLQDMVRFSVRVCSTFNTMSPLLKGSAAGAGSSPKN